MTAPSIGRQSHRKELVVKDMHRGWMLALAMFPAMGHAVICQTVGDDGVVSFTNVPGSECPRGSELPEYSAPARAVERAQQVDTGISARQVKFPGYREIAIASPEDDGVVRNNAGSVTVQLALEPALKADHFVTAYLDGKSVQGRYGSSQVQLTGVDPGEHELRAKVSDAQGKTLIEAKTISFTLLRALPLQVRGVGPKAINGVFLGGPQATGSKVTVRFPSGKEYTGEVDAGGGWTVEVEGEPLAESRFDVTVSSGNLEFKRTQAINPALLQQGGGTFEPSGGADFTPDGGAISTTPGTTNPAFAPKYNP